jgi:hypothetical protein
MAKELPYFKFEPSEWLEGEIQVCSDESIVCFINLCSGYWLKLGSINYAFALHKYCKKDARVLQELIDSKIISLIEDKIGISFLDKQLNEFKEISEKRTSAANKRWENKEENASAMQVHSKSNAIREDKSREKEIKEKRIVKKFSPPLLQDVILYFTENEYSKELAVKAFKYYETGDWKDGKGNQVRNWKQKMQSVWFKEENKTTAKPKFISPA